MPPHPLLKQPSCRFPQTHLTRPAHLSSLFNSMMFSGFCCGGGGLSVPRCDVGYEHRARGANADEKVYRMSPLFLSTQWLRKQVKGFSLLFIYFTVFIGMLWPFLSTRESTASLWLFFLSLVKLYLTVYPVICMLKEAPVERRLASCCWPDTFLTSGRWGLTPRGVDEAAALY